MIRSFKELDVWKLAMELSREIFELSKRFPPEERYSLTDQIRRASRSVAANIAEAWHKRRYPAAFVSKLNDAEAESGETQTWIEHARSCGYLSDEVAARLEQGCENLIGKLIRMMNHPKDWCAGLVAATTSIQRTTRR